MVGLKISFMIKLAGNMLRDWRCFLQSSILKFQTDGESRDTYTYMAYLPPYLYTSTYLPIPTYLLYLPTYLHNIQSEAP